MHPAKEGFSALPFFDEFDLSTVDILLISQYVECSSPFHLQSSRRCYNHFLCKRVQRVRVGNDQKKAVAQPVISGGSLSFNDTDPSCMYTRIQYNLYQLLILCFHVCIFVFTHSHWMPDSFASLVLDELP